MNGGSMNRRAAEALDLADDLATLLEAEMVGKPSPKGDGAEVQHTPTANISENRGQHGM